jgi:hypothetical protein
MCHQQIRPVQRDCICPTERHEDHTLPCDTAYRAKFFGAWTRERQRFYFPELFATGLLDDGHC